MKVYLLNHLDLLRTHRPVHFATQSQSNPVGELIKIAPQIKGFPIKDDWFPPHITFDDSQLDLPLGDYAYFILGPVFSLRATTILDKFLKSNGELLPLQMMSEMIEPYFFYNVTTLTDALIMEESKMNSLKSNIDHHSFNGDKIKGLSVFKLTQLPQRNVYVTDDFMDALSLSDLTGFNPRPVWSD